MITALFLSLLPWSTPCQREDVDRSVSVAGRVAVDPGLPVAQLRVAVIGAAKPAPLLLPWRWDHRRHRAFLAIDESGRYRHREPPGDFPCLGVQLLWRREWPEGQIPEEAVVLDWSELQAAEAGTEIVPAELQAAGLPWVSVDLDAGNLLRDPAPGAAAPKVLLTLEVETTRDNGRKRVLPLCRRWYGSEDSLFPLSPRWCGTPIRAVASDGNREVRGERGVLQPGLNILGPLVFPPRAKLEGTIARASAWAEARLSLRPIARSPDEEIGFDRYGLAADLPLDGSFSFGWIPPGSYRLEVEDRRYAYPGLRPALAVQTLELAANEEKSLHLTLPEPQVILHPHISGLPPGVEADDLELWLYGHLSVCGLSWVRLDPGIHPEVRALAMEVGETMQLSALNFPTKGQPLVVIQACYTALQPGIWSWELRPLPTTLVLTGTAGTEFLEIRPEHADPWANGSYPGWDAIFPLYVYLDEGQPSRTILGLPPGDYRITAYRFSSASAPRYEIELASWSEGVR